MSSFKDLVKKVNEEKNQDKSKEKEEKSGSSFKDLVNEVNSGSYKVASKLNDSQVSDWFGGINTVSKQGYSYLSKNGYREADTDLANKIDSYLSQANDVGQYLRANRSSLSNYDELMQNYHDTVSYLRSLQSGVNSTNKYYSHWDSEEHYFKTSSDTRADRQKAYADNQDKIKALQEEKNKPGTSFSRKMQITAEIAALQVKNTQYERGEDGWTSKRLDDNYAYTEAEDFESGSANRNIVNPTREALDYYDAMTDSSTWYYDAKGVRRDAFGNEIDMTNVDANNRIVHPMANDDKYSVKDRLGMYLNATDADVSEAVGMMDTSEGSWAKVLADGEYYHWDNLTSTEIDIYYYLLNTQGTASADKFLDDMEVELAKRETMGNIQKWEEDYENADILGKIFLNAASVPANVFGGAIGYIDDVGRSLTGQDYNPYNIAHSGMHYTNTVRGLTAEDLDETGFKIPLLEFTLGDIYQTGMSRLDSALATGIGGGAGTVLLGMGAAQNEGYRLYRQGASAEQIAWGALTAGAAEVVWEYASFEKLVNLKDAKTIGLWVKNALIQAGFEAGEEFMTELSNTITNAIIMGNQSDLAKLYEENSEDGFKTFLGLVQQHAQAAFGGFLGGIGAGVTQGGKTYINTQKSFINTGNAIRSADGGVDALKNLANEVAGVQAGNVTGEVASGKGIGKLIAGVKNLNRDQKVGKLYDTVRTSLDTQSHADIVKTLTRGENAFSEKKANAIAGALIAQANGMELTPEQSRLLESVKDNPKVQRSLNAVINNENSTMGQRNQQMRDFTKDVKAGVISKAYGVSAEAVKAVMEGKLTTEEEIAPERTYEVSTDGKTLDSKGNEIKIVGIESVEDGKLILKTENGTIDSSEVQYATEAEALIYEAVAKLGATPISAWHMIKAWDESSGVTAEQYAAELEHAYLFGKLNYKAGMANLNVKSATAFQKGREDAEASVKATTQASTESTLSEKNADKKIIFEGFTEKEQRAIKGLSKASMAAIDMVNKVTNLEVHVYKSYKKDGKLYAMVNGKERSAPNGYFTDGNKIYIDINAGNAGTGLMLFTMSHEMGHYIAKWNAQDFKAISDFLFEHYGENVPILAMLKYQKEKLKASYKEDGKPIPSEAQLEKEAQEELVCEMLSRMMADKYAYDKLLELKQNDLKLHQKLGQVIKKVLDKIAKAIGIYDTQSPDFMYAASKENFGEEAFRQLQDLYLKAFVQADANFKTAEKNTTDDGGVLYLARDKKNNVVVDEDVDPQALRMKLTEIYNGNYQSDNNYFPVLKNTPWVYRHYCRLDADRSFVMAKKKAYKAMQQKNKKQHALGVDGLMYVIENLGTPNYIVYQNVGEYAGNYAAIIISEEREIFAAVQLGEYKDALYAPNGEKGFYNTLITAFYPNDGYIDNNILIPENDIVFDIEEDPLQVASSVTPSDRAEESSTEKVPQTESVVKSELEESGIGFDEETKTVFALRDSTAYKDILTVGSKKFDTEAIAQLVAKGTGRSIEDARKWVNSELSIANIIMANPEFLDFEPDDRYDAIKKNSDYPQGTVDLSNLCPKREEFTAMFDMLQKKYPNKLFTAQDIADMRKILSNAKLTVACGACFVEDRRQLVGEIADTYINMWKEAVETGKPLQKTNAAGQKVELLVTKALAKQYGLTAGTKIMATDTYIPNQYDLTTYEGFKLLEKNHPTIAMGFNRYNNSRGQQSARLIEGRAEYKRQILGWTDAKIRTVNNNGGLRIFSFSDFEVVHLLDLVQVIIDCAAKGVKIQGYTKIPAFAKLVRDTGIKLNRSHIPLGDLGYHMENGKVVLDCDTKEGIDTNDENFLDEDDNPNVGDVIIGINPTQIAAAMLDPFFDYIIPFHSNKAKAILEKLGTGKWVNYKESQHEKDISTGTSSKHNVNIYTQVINKYHPTNKVEFVDAFLKECKKQGKIPRYAEFLNKEYKADGAYQDEGGSFDYTYREGYHKLLVDFKMFDKNGNILPQGNITPKLDEGFMKELLNAEIDKKQSYEFPQEVYDAIDKKFGETKFSDRDSDGNQLSKEQQEFFKSSVVRDAKGNLLVMYHGTANGGAFTVFDGDQLDNSSLKSQIGQGFYFTNMKNEAESYMKNVDIYGRVSKGKNPNLHQVYLNITNPFDVYADTLDIDKVKSVYMDGTSDHFFNSFIPHYLNNTTVNGRVFTKAEVQDMSKADRVSLYVDYMAQIGTKELLSNMVRAFPYGKQSELLTAMQKRLGYDGIVEEYAPGKYQYVAFSSEQIKFVDNKNPTSNPDIRYSDRDNAPTFYSQMAKVVDAVKQEKLGAASVVSMLRGKGVKAEEIKWSGIEEWLEGKKSVTKAELQEFIAGSMLQIEEEVLDNKDRPYTEDQQKRLDEFEAKRDEVARRLADEWKKITGEDFPIRNTGAGLESAVVNKIIDANKEHKDAAFEGRLLKKLRKDLEEVIKNNDDFGFDSWKDALRSIHRHRRDFITHYEMSTNDKAIIVKYCNALNAYNELANKFSDADTDKLRAIARETDPWNRKIMEVKNEHNEEEAKYMTNWGQYRLEGGRNYREMLFRIPGSTYTNESMMTHWKDRTGVLAHARVQDMDTFLGKMLFIEEIQSDWHNAGRKDGYRDPGQEDKYTLSKKMEEYTEEFFASPIADVVRERIGAIGYEGSGVSMILNFLIDSQESMESTLNTLSRKGASFTDSEVNEIANYAREYEEIYHKWENAPGDLTAPDAPFRDTYHEYVLKRLLREAAEQEYDSIGWTTAETQDDRWQNNMPHKEGTGKSGFLKAYTIEYDQNIRNFLSKFGQKWGTKVGKTTLDNGTEVWSMAITDSMKESVMTEGQALYSDRVLMGSLFSGGGTLEAGLVYQMLDKQFGVEFDARIASVYADNHGDHIRVGRVEDFDISKFEDIFYLHASPVCHNFSAAKHGAKELQMDINSAKATAKHLETAMPQVFTVENAPGYRKSESLKIITDKLTELGYKWDVDVYNSADYGSATSRNRVILRAVKDGELPAKPEKQERTNSWDKVTRDLWDTLPKATLRPSFISAIENTRNLPILDANGKVNVNKPLLILTTTSGHTVTYCWEGDICPTLTTKCGEARLIMPDGNIYAVTPEFMGRIQGLPDDYKYPKEKTRAFTIIGNGIPTHLTKAVVGGVLDSAYEQTHEGKVLYQDRTEDSVSNRALLANAFEGIAKPEEMQKLQEYKDKISLINAEEKKLRELNAQIKELSFAEGPRDTKRINALRFDANQAANRINTYDKQLLRLEASQPLQDVLAREKKKAYQKAEKRGKEALAAYKEKTAKTQRELLDRWKESRKKAVEGREKTVVRHKIQSVVGELNQLLLNDDKKRHVPDSLKKAVAEALALVNMDTVGAEERIAKYEALIARESDPDKIDAYTVTLENIKRQGEKMGQKLKDLRDAYEEIANSDDPDIANGYDPVISASLKELAESIGNTALKDMSIEQLEDVYTMYKMVLTRVRDANKSLIESIKESISSRASRVVGEVKATGGEHKHRASILDPIKAFFWNNAKPVYAMEHIGSSTMTEAFNNVRKGEDTWAKDVSEARAYYIDKSKKYGYDSWDFDEKHTFKSTSENEFELTLEQVMALYAYSKREQALEHLRLGGFVFDSSIEVHKENDKGQKSILKYKVNTADAYQLSPEILANIIGTLTEEQRRFVDEMQDYLSTTMGAKGNEVTMKMYGVKLFKEKFYFPLKSAKQFMFEQNEVAGEVKIKNSGFTNKTKPKANNPVILDNFMDVWANHVNDMSMYHAFVLPLEDFNRIFNYNSPKQEGVPSVSVKGTIQNAYSPAAVNYLKQLITDLNGGAMSDSRETFAKSLTAKFKKAKVFSSLSVVIQQPSAIGRAFALVDPKYFHPTKDGMNHDELWAELKQYAPVAIIKEMGYFDTNMGKSTQDFIKAKEYTTFKEKAKAVFTDSGYRDEILSKAPALADELTWCAIWNAVKRETIAKNPGLDIKSEPFLMLAGARFTEVITKTQVYDSVLARSANMRSKSGLMSMITSFMAEPTTSINMLEDALLKRKRGYKGYAARAFASVAVSVIINNALVALVYGMRDDDEDETFAEKYMQAFVSGMLDDINPLTYYPFLKDMWSLLQGYDIERSDMSLFSDFADSVKSLVKAYTSEDGDVVGAWHDLVGTVANIGGVPLDNIRRELNGAINFLGTIIEDINGRATTWRSIGDAVLTDVRNSLPVVGWLPGESKADNLYDAIISGDTAYVNRLKGSYKTEDAYHNAVRKALRENDPRIMEAAKAQVNGDPSERVRIQKLIIADGFAQDDVVAATNTEINKMKPDDSNTTAKAKGYYTAEDFALEIANGDHASANAVKVDIIQTAQKNGKTAEEAEKSFNNSAKDELKDLYLADKISADKAINALTTYCGIERDDAVSDIQYWDFKQDYPDVFADDAWIDEYYEEVESSGISLRVFVDYRNKVKGITGEGKKESRMAVINSLPITSAQKDALYYAEGWAESKLYEAPWH